MAVITYHRHSCGRDFLCGHGGVCVYRGAPAEAEQPLGTATRVETPDAERGYEMNGKDVGGFKLGSGCPAEDQHGIVPGPL